MNVNAAISVNPASHEESRQFGPKELIDRLAENLRQSSDTDLPHSYFVEQVQLQLAGQQNEARRSDPELNEAANDTSRRYQSAACFKAWAIPD